MGGARFVEDAHGFLIYHREAGVAPAAPLIEHYEIKSSPAVVRYFLKRVFENVTKPTSVNNIYNGLKSQGMKVAKDSLYDWLDYAGNIFLQFHRSLESDS